MFSEDFVQILAKSSWRAEHLRKLDGHLKNVEVQSCGLTGKSMILFAFCGPMAFIKSHIFTIKRKHIFPKFEDSSEESCCNQK